MAISNELPKNHALSQGDPIISQSLTMERSRLRDYRSFQTPPPPPPRIPRRPRGNPPRPILARLVLGVDTLGVLAVDTEHEASPLVTLDAARRGEESDGDQARIDAASAAVNRLTSEKLDTLRHHSCQRGRQPSTSYTCR